MPLLIRPQAREKNSGSASTLFRSEGSYKGNLFFFKPRLCSKKDTSVITFIVILHSLWLVILNSDIMFTDSLMKFCFYDNA